MPNNIFSKSDGFRSEYSSAVVRIGECKPIEGSDFLSKTLVFGTQIVVRKDQIKEGDLVIYASNETQLSERFLSVNNLFEISCRDKNSNADFVNGIMAEYEPIKEKADKLRTDARNVKASIDQMTKRAQKFNKEAKRIASELEKTEDGTDVYRIKKGELDELRNKADDYTRRALEKTTVYTNLKKAVEDTVNSGKHIVDEAKKHVGFFNKYGRVRCVTLKGVASFGFVFKLPELQNLYPDITEQDLMDYEGQEFDTINGELFCKVFIPPVKEQPQRKNKEDRDNKKLKRFDRLIDGEFKFHYDTQQLGKVIQFIKPDDIVDISVKRHGTSIIIGKLHVKEKISLPFPKNVWNWIVDNPGLFKSRRIKDYNVVYGPIYSSRKVIKNKYINENVTQGYYKKDVWSEYGDIIYPYLDEGMTVYGEICGYETESESPIQKFYDYGCGVGENNIMFYRITTTNDDGSKKEWDVSSVKDWTESLIGRMKESNDDNWKRVHPIDHLYHGTLGDLYPDLDIRSHWHESVLESIKADKEHFLMEENEPMCKNVVPREGVCIRVESDPMFCAKCKTNSFLIGESIRVSENEVDMEMTEGYS